LRSPTEVDGAFPPGTFAFFYSSLFLFSLFLLTASFYPPFAPLPDDRSAAPSSRQRSRSVLLHEVELSVWEVPGRKPFPPCEKSFYRHFWSSSRYKKVGKRPPRGGRVFWLAPRDPPVKVRTTIFVNLLLVNVCCAGRPVRPPFTEVGSSSVPLGGLPPMGGSFLVIVSHNWLSVFARGHFLARDWTISPSSKSFCESPSGERSTSK